MSVYLRVVQHVQYIWSLHADHHRTFSIGFDKDNVDKRQDWRDLVWQFLIV